MSAAITAAVLFVFVNARAQSPVGYVNVNVKASPDGHTYAVTQLSCVLEPFATVGGQLTTRITGVGANTLSASAGGWTSAALAVSGEPHYAKIATGSGAGEIYRITANTTTTLTLDTGGVDLQTLGIVSGTDRLEIVSGYTLESLIGTPAEGVIGGTSADFAANAVDKVLLNDSTGVARFYYYDTTASQWRRAGSAANQGNLPISPYAGVAYYRISTQPVALMFTGHVPDSQARIQVPSSGTTLVAPYFPVPTTLGELGFQSLPTWRKLGDTGVTLNDTDRVLAEDSFGVVRSYYFDGTIWKRAGSNSNQGALSIAPGSAIYLTRFGGGPRDTLVRPMPYTLD